MVTVKKYGNRRLYDTGSSSYINLEQLAEMIRQGTEVQVVDAKSGEDLTREVLLQVVMEVLQGGDLLSASMLRRMIRSTGTDPWSRMINQQLIAGLRVLSNQMDQAESLFGAGGMPNMSNPFAMPGMPGFAGAAPKPPPPKPAPAPEPAPPEQPSETERSSGELEELRARLADIEKLLKG